MSRRDVLMVLVALVAGLVGGAASSWFLMGSLVFAQKAPQSEKVLQAERFEVIDQAEKVRAKFGMLPDGTPLLMLLDQTEKSRVELSMETDGSPHLALYDRGGNNFIALAVLPDSSAHLQLFDQAGKLRITLGTAPDGSPDLELLDQSKTLRAALGSVQLEDRRTGSVETRSPSSLVLFGKDGKVLWQAP